MGVAQLTLSCDRLFITSLCFIRLFPISSIWRADRGAGTPNVGFRLPMRRLAPNRMLEAIHPHRDHPSPLKRAVVPAAEPRLALFPRKSAASINIKAGCAPSGSVSDPDHGSGLQPSPSEIGGPDRRLDVPRISWHGLRTSRLNRREFGGLESAACGSPPRRAYRPYRSCGRVAEGGGLLNRYRVVKPYRGFESLRLRQQIKLSEMCRPVAGISTIDYPTSRNPPSQIMTCPLMKLSEMRKAMACATSSGWPTRATSVLEA